MNALPEASRPAGLTRLATFVAQSLVHYSKSRNFDFGPGRRHNVSVLSPYVRHRLVTEQEVLETIFQRHSYTAADKFVQEVFWRTYFKGWLEHRPEVWGDYRANVAQLLKKLESDSILMRRYTSAVEGQTGIDCFDSWAVELKQNGYLHNHTRMWFASIWIFTLGLPWELGADFFLRNLLDGDPASNTLSWRWVAGLHTKGKTYLALSSNIARYTDNRFDPSGQLAESAPPMEESRVFPIRQLQPADPAPTGRAYGLLITEEDASPETLAINYRPRSILGVVATAQRSPLPVSKQVQHFATGAITDALRRSTQHFGIDGQFANTDDWKNLLTDWAVQNDFQTIVTGYAPVGPVAEMLAATKLHLHEKGIELVQVRRPYDSLAWPHAQRGYFKLKARIPELLDALDIDIQEEHVTERSEAV